MRRAATGALRSSAARSRRTAHDDVSGITSQLVDLVLQSEVRVGSPTVSPRVWRGRSRTGDQQALKRRGRLDDSGELARPDGDRVGTLLRSIVPCSLRNEIPPLTGGRSMRSGLRAALCMGEPTIIASRPEAGFIGAGGVRDGTTERNSRTTCAHVREAESVSTDENVGRPTFTSYICQVPQDQGFRATSGAAHYRRVPS